MMGDLTLTLNESLKQQLQKNHLELVDLFPIPLYGDQRVRLQTLEEVLEELERSQNEGTQGYLIQIKPKTREPQLNEQPQTLHDPQLLDDQIHFADGKLNTLFLLKNADLLIENGDYHPARMILNAVLATGDYLGVTHLKLAQCYEHEQELDSATEHYEKSIHYQPCFEAYQRLSTLFIHQGKQREAAEALERALSQKGLSPSIRFELHKTAGNCWTRLQGVQEAEANYKKALEIMPHADEIRSNLATLYLQGGNTTDAKRNFQDALASNPRNYQALSGLATCYFHEGNKTLAHDSFVQSLEIEINNPNALLYLVKCAYEIKTFTAAARLLSAFLKNSPENNSLIYALAGLEFHLGRLEEAKSHAAQVLEIDPEHSGALELSRMIQNFSHQNN